MVRDNASRDVASDSGAVRSRQRRSLYRDHEPLVRALALALIAVAIAGYQANLLPYFGQTLSGLPGWRAAYYGFGLLLLATTCAAFIFNNHAKRVTLPVVVLCTLSGLLILVHPFDLVAKSFLAAMVLCASLAIITNCAGQTRVLSFAAVAVTFNAVMCLVDIMLPEGFTNTLGRAAGLAQGPNLAASQLVLGAVVVWRAVPPRLLWSFLFLVAAAIIATLSRSGLMVAVMAVVTASTEHVIKRSPHIDAIRWRDVGVGAVVLCWMAAAMVVNHRFSTASGVAYKTMGQAANAVAEAPAAMKASTSAKAIRSELKEIDKRILTEGNVNSASARSLLMRRAFIRYTMSPWVGIGPEEAHKLAPHSTYLLLALAFGVGGLVVPFGFIWMAARTGNWEFPLALAGLFAVSHDILLFPSIIVILAVGLTVTTTRRE